MPSLMLNTCRQCDDTSDTNASGKLVGVATLVPHWYSEYGGHADLPKLVHETPEGLSQFTIHAQGVVLVDV